MRGPAVSRPQPADREPPSLEAHARGTAQPRAARQVGLLLPRSRGRGAAGRDRPTPGGLRMSTDTAAALREQVRERYAEAARAVTEGGSGCCGDSASVDFGESLYTADQRGELPDAAALASLGCGNPTAVADLREGEVVLDLGSGGGIDVILSAKRVGPAGVAYGLDMTDEMLSLAQESARQAGISNAHFLKGEIENVPLPAESVDVV